MLNQFMRVRAIGAAAGISCAVLLIGAAGAPAFADDGDTTGDSTTIHTEPQTETEEAVTDVAADQMGTEPGIPSTPPGEGNHPGSELCDVMNVYTPTYKSGYHMKGVGATHANTNNTTHNITSTFTSTATGTVGVSLTGSLMVSANVMIGKIEAKCDVNLSASLTVTQANSVAAITPLHKATYAKYGVYRLRNQGTSYHIYSSCATSTRSTVTSYTPHHIGWYVWETSV
ncbi:hypothetical protein OHA59_23405 [Streptomyces sp. NBC_01589]|uniref:hypothetical protein n=1 Tax=Streptomyces sp. NBC_01589 TaxID=2975886 RepID=UPI003868355E